MGYCKHHWHESTSVLREVFHQGEARLHVFYVCTLCLKIDEVEARPVAVEDPTAADGDEVAA